MGTFNHILRSNKLSQQPTRLIFYDTETLPTEESENVLTHRLRLGWACAITRYGGGKRVKEEWCCFTSIEGFWDFVLGYLHKKSKVYLIAHNQHFDFPVVDGFNYLANKGFRASKPILDSNLFIMTFRKDGRCIEVLDSLNWFKFSLEQLGANIGLPKLQIDFESCSLEQLRLYCRRDVEILKCIFMEYLKFLKDYDLGNFQKTIASQSFTAFRHRFMQDDIYIHANKTVTELERASYRGGRNEAFLIGKTPAEVIGLDFNSLYPAVMVEAELPVKLIKFTHCVDVKGLQRFMRHYCVTTKVNITVDQPCIGIKGERLLFPIGTFDCVLTTPELQYVLEHHRINSVECCAVYEKAKLFEEYINELYSLRQRFKQQGNRVYNLLTKLFLNSLYGKFGQRNESIKKVGSCAEDLVIYERIINYHTNEVYLKWAFAGSVYVKTKEYHEARHSFVAIASHITALARLKLWKAIVKAGRDNVYYCDTDSVFVNKEGYHNLKNEIDEYRLGALKVEYKNEDMIIFGCKDYQLGKKRKIKGVKEHATKITTNKYRQNRFLKFRSLLRRGSLDAPIEEYYTKELKREYKKGVINVDGKVTPFRLP